MTTLPRIWSPAHWVYGYVTLYCGRTHPRESKSEEPPATACAGTVFPDRRLVTAIVDPVTFNAHITKTGTKSYRLRPSRTTTRANRAV